MCTESSIKMIVDDKMEIMSLQDRVDLEYLRSIVYKQLNVNKFVVVNDSSLLDRETSTSLISLYNYKPKNYNVFIDFDECNKEMIYTMDNIEDKISFTFSVLKEEIQLDRLRSNSDTSPPSNNTIKEKVNEDILMLIQEITGKKNRSYKKIKKSSSIK